MSSPAPISEYDEELAALLDDGYSEEDALELLGPPPAAPAPLRSVLLEVAGEPEVAPPEPQRPARAPRRPTEGDRRWRAAWDKAESHPAPVLPPKGTLSFGAKKEMVAKAMAELRGLKWYELPKERREPFFALAEFALQAIERVERAAEGNIKRRKEIGSFDWEGVPERRG